MPAARVAVSEIVTGGRMKWEKIRMEFLNLDYGLLLSSEEANRYLALLEDEIEYNGSSEVKVFGKWWPIPRQQVAFGEKGLTYKFSGNRIPAKDWTDTIMELKNTVEKATGYEYNFVLVNRYRDGRDHIGEHRDSEPEIDQTTPIASLSLGASRDFLFRRKKPGSPTVRKLLENGVSHLCPCDSTGWAELLLTLASLKGSCDLSQFRSGGMPHSVVTSLARVLISDDNRRGRFQMIHDEKRIIP